MLLDVLGRLLPLAVAVAISSVPITATLLILLSPNQRRSSLPFLLGWIVGIAGLAVLFTWGAGEVPTRADAHPEVVFGIVLIVIGVALEVFAVIAWRRSRSQPAGIPKWLRAVGSLRPWQAAGLGLILNLRPKGLLLAVAAGLSVRSQPLSVGQMVVAIAVYTAIAALTVGVPVVYTLASPRRAEPRLLVVREWIEKNNRVVSILIMLVIGFVIIGNGLTRL